MCSTELGLLSQILGCFPHCMSKLVSLPNSDRPSTSWSLSGSLSSLPQPLSERNHYGSGAVQSCAPGCCLPVRVLLQEASDHKHWRGIFPLLDRENKPTAMVIACHPVFDFTLPVRDFGLVSPLPTFLPLNPTHPTRFLSHLSFFPIHSSAWPLPAFFQPGTESQVLLGID